MIALAAIAVLLLLGQPAPNIGTAPPLKKTATKVQDKPPTAQLQDKPRSTKLSESQRIVVAQYKSFENRLRQAADVLKSIDPQRSVLASRAATQAKSALIAVQLERIQKQLADAESAVERDDVAALAKAAKDQRGMLAELDSLIAVLLSDDRSKLSKELREAIEKRMKSLEQLKREQIELQSATDRLKDGDTNAPLTDAQRELAERTAKQVPKESEPSAAPPMQSPGADGKPKEAGEPSESKSVKDAQQAMDRAKKSLDEKKKSKASKEQSQAIAKLEDAVRRLALVLRQMREEERLQALISLESRCQKLLDGEKAIAERTALLAKTAVKDRTRTDLRKAIELAPIQQSLALETEKSLQVVREDNIAVAFDESLVMVRDDMVRIAARFRDADVGPGVKSLIDSVIGNLQEMVQSLRREVKESRDRSEGGGGSAQEQALLDRLAELRLLASLQRHIQARTKLTSEWYESNQSPTETQRLDLQETLTQLAARQKRVYEITRELATREQP